MIDLVDLVQKDGMMPHQELEFVGALNRVTAQIQYEPLLPVVIGRVNDEKGCGDERIGVLRKEALPMFITSCSLQAALVHATCWDRKCIVFCSRIQYSVTRNTSNPLIVSVLSRTAL